MKPTTYFQLIQALKSGGPISTTKGDLRVVNGVAREDGSGHSFNVTGIDNAGANATIHVSTID